MLEYNPRRRGLLNYGMVAVGREQSAFIDAGDTDMYKAMRTYKEVGFRGILIPDHVPNMTNDVPWAYMARAYAIGYMTALLEVVNSV